MLKDQMFRLCGHHEKLAQTRNAYNASAPEMISISSFVMLAWRWRL
jgi:hypothetical protein